MPYKCGCFDKHSPSFSTLFFLAEKLVWTYCQSVSERDSLKLSQLSKNLTASSVLVVAGSWKKTWVGCGSCIRFSRFELGCKANDYERSQYTIFQYSDFSSIAREARYPSCLLGKRHWKIQLWVDFSKVWFFWVFKVKILANLKKVDVLTVIDGFHCFDRTQNFPVLTMKYVSHTFVVPSPVCPWGNFEFQNCFNGLIVSGVFRIAIFYHSNLEVLKLC